MIRFLIEQGYQDRETQSAISEALGIIYNANKTDDPDKKDDNNSDKSDLTIESKDEDTN